MTKAPDIIMYVGEQYYTLHDYISEALQQGVHKRISSASIPDGIVPWESKIFLAHSKAILRTNIGELADLAYELLDRGYMTQVQYNSFVENTEPFWTGEELKPEDFVPAQMLMLATVLSTVPANELAEIEIKWGVEYFPGVFGYAYIAGMHYICKPDEDDLPLELRHMKDLIEPVHVKLVEDEDVKDKVAGGEG